MLLMRWKKDNFVFSTVLDRMLTKGKQSKMCEGSPSQPYCNGRHFVGQKVYLGEGGIHAVRL